MSRRGTIIDKLCCRYILAWCVALLLAVNLAYGQSVATIRESDFGDLQQVQLTDSLWSFHPGEFSGPKKPVTDVSGGRTFRGTSFGEDNPIPGWYGVGWFGIWVKVDTALVNRKLAVRINHDGASEIFIDGKPMGGYGKLGRSAAEMVAARAPRDMIPVWFSDTRPHLITIHYSNFKPAYSFLGFQLFIGDYQFTSQRMADDNRLLNYIQLCAAAQIILALLHFLLFLFYPKQRLNLYYAIYVGLVGVTCAGVYLFYQAHSPFTQYAADALTGECKVLLMSSGVLLLYHLNYARIPRWRVVALSAVTLFYIIIYFVRLLHIPDQERQDYFSIVYFFCMMDGFWSVWQVIRRGQKNVWLVATGVVAVTLLYYFCWADVFQLWPPRLNAMRVFVLSAGELILPLCLSVYLALDFAHTNQSLTARLAEVERLSEQALIQETEKRTLLAEEARRLEELVQQRTAELRAQADQLREMDSVKSRFFTNITHEFKTPLTLIINPAKDLISQVEEEQTVRQLQLILNNATRLLQLINQLLDLSKLESGLMEVNAEPMDLASLIKVHIASYESLIRHKGLQINFASAWEQLWILGDQDKFDTIILNLLSNAVKFTDKGSIEFSLLKDTSQAGDAFTLMVRDTGRGIPSEKLDYIFARFYQADPSDTRSAEGTGIGLALTKELVELMGGRISAESEENVFTQISINMPYVAATAAPAQIIKPASVGACEITEDSPLIASLDDERPLVLLIEDHDELRDFIRQSLAVKYRVLSAADGSKGIALAKEHIPNLVITDLMMPLTNGYRVSDELKHDQRTSHIPIIILTAKTDFDSRIQGIETGADAYLAKPFEKRELFAVIENLISTRRQLREYYSSRDLWFSDTIVMPSIEQEFIKRVRRAVETHLDEEGYSAEQLARDVGLSRTQLHRKLKDLIGQAPGELIRIIRLQYAHNLLQRQVATVAEVGYMVGYSSPASFSASFSRHFGFPPKRVVHS
ncbi:MAG TPA: ATP-binding protein [Mucilaginibacter sp.]|nr:ATP-binding protein [Mucilaginibacter sp.]